MVVRLSPNSPLHSSSIVWTLWVLPTLSIPLGSDKEINYGIWWFPRTVKSINAHAYKLYIYIYGDKGWFLSPDTVVRRIVGASVVPIAKVRGQGFATRKSFVPRLQHAWIVLISVLYLYAISSTADATMSRFISMNQSSSSPLCPTHAWFKIIFAINDGGRLPKPPRALVSIFALPLLPLSDFCHHPFRLLECVNNSGP